MILYDTAAGGEVYIPCNISILKENYGWNKTGAKHTRLNIIFRYIHV